MSVQFSEREGGGLFAAVDERGRLAETGWQAFPTLMCAALYMKSSSPAFRPWMCGRACKGHMEGWDPVRSPTKVTKWCKLT